MSTMQGNGRPFWADKGIRLRFAASPQGRRLRFESLEDRRLLAILTVNTLVDENNGVGTGGVSLREAVAAANSGDTINFSVTGTINLTNTGSGHIQINKNLTIQGPGANLLTIKAFDPDAAGTNNNNGQRVFLVDDGSGSLVNVTLGGLTLTNGDPPIDDPDNAGGGAILNRENLTINSCVLTNNFAPNGGAIDSHSGALTITDSSITQNNGGDGGAILIDGGSLALTRVTISGNVVTNSGGGIVNRATAITLVDSTISGNFTDEFGGGIYQYQGSCSISGTTISGNTADANHDQTGSGGGVYNMAGSLSVVNSTISGNSAGEDGGGIYSNTGQTISISHTTITSNVIPASGAAGGGISSKNSVSLNHTIVAGNLRGATTRDDVDGSFTTSYSLIGDKGSASVTNSGGSLIGTSISPIDAKLATLANNGGLTLTHALLSGSPALDAGNPAAVAGSGGIPQFDQRGTPYSRVVDFDGVGGARIDIGAVEMTPAGPALPGDYNVNRVVDAADYVLWRKTQGSTVPAYSGADGDGNGAVNSGDYTVWRKAFGSTSPGGGAGDQTTVEQLSMAGGSQAVNVGSGAGFALVQNVNSGSAKQSTSALHPETAVVDSAMELLLIEAQERGNFAAATVIAQTSSIFESTSQSPVVFDVDLAALDAPVLAEIL